MLEIPMLNVAINIQCRVERTAENPAGFPDHGCGRGTPAPDEFATSIHIICC